MDAAVRAMEICQRNLASPRQRQPIADPPPDHYRQHDDERLKTAEIFIDCKPGAFRDDFHPYLVDNFHVYKAFEREADRVWDRGFRHYSARTIIEVLRHQSALADTDGMFKLNDWWTPDLARLYMMMQPQRAGFFETRSGNSAKRDA